jgi:hypothetical protein
MGDHDPLFKRAFSVPAHAAGELRSVLPASVVEAIEWPALELVPASFVDEEMRHRHADLLFRAPLRDGSGQSYLYVLLEHQSEPDRLMPYRMLGYVQRIWDAVVRDEPGRTSLPPVIPVVVHHGEAGWSVPRSLHALVEGIASGAIPELSRFVPNFELCIDDLVSIGDEALRARPMAPLPKVTLWLLRDGRQLEAFLASLASWGGNEGAPSAAARDATASGAGPRRFASSSSSPRDTSVRGVSPPPVTCLRKQGTTPDPHRPPRPSVSVTAEASNGDYRVFCGVRRQGPRDRRTRELRPLRLGPDPPRVYSPRPSK